MSDWRFSVKSFPRACYGRSSSAWMAFFTYVDCSGDAIDPNARVISVAGYIGHEGQWARFEERWMEVLRSFGVDALHMKEYAHSTKGSQFETWKGNTQKRNDFMAALTDVINGCDFQSVSVTLPLGEYEKANQELLIREGFGTPYAVAALKAVAESAEWHTRHSHNEPLMILLEKGDNEQASFNRLLERFGEWNLDLVAPPIIQRKKWKTASGETRYCVPFQAADFLCYEHAKMFADLLKTGKRTVRESIFRVSYPPRGDEEMNQVLHAEWMRQMADRFKVARRSNRPADGVSEMPAEALCFLDMDQPLVAIIIRRVGQSRRCEWLGRRLVQSEQSDDSDTNHLFAFDYTRLVTTWFREEDLGHLNSKEDSFSSRRRREFKRYSSEKRPVVCAEFEDQIASASLFGPQLRGDCHRCPLVGEGWRDEIGQDSYQARLTMFIKERVITDVDEISSGHYRFLGALLRRTAESWCKNL